MLTSEEMAQFSAIEQGILTSVPSFVRYLCARQNAYGDRLMSDAFDALVLVPVMLRCDQICFTIHEQFSC